ncbi:hypothetical protein MTO96_047169 [Rhipicephalus appendiculatus]
MRSQVRQSVGRLLRRSTRQARRPRFRVGPATPTRPKHASRVPKISAPVVFGAPRANEPAFKSFSLGPAPFQYVGADASQILATTKNNNGRTKRRRSFFKGAKKRQNEPQPPGAPRRRGRRLCSLSDVSQGATPCQAPRRCAPHGPDRMFFGGTLLAKIKPFVALFSFARRSLLRWTGVSTTTTSGSERRTASVAAALFVRHPSHAGVVIRRCLNRDEREGTPEAPVGPGPMRHDSAATAPESV